MPVAGALAVGSAGAGIYAADRAAGSQKRAAAQARQDQLPFMHPGRGAIATLAQLYGINPETGEQTGQPFPEGSLEAFRRSPDYQFASDEGRRQVEFSNAGRGLLRSGNNMRDLTTFGQGLATQQFGNYRGALERLAAMGQGAAGAAGAASMQEGAAKASGWVGGANSVQSALGSLGNYYMLSNLVGQQQGGMNGTMKGAGSLSAYGQTPTALPPYAPASAGMPGYAPGALPTGFF